MANTKKIGFIPCVATAIGIVVSSSALTLLGEGFGAGGTAFLVAMVIGACLNLFVAFSFAELAGILPAAVVIIAALWSAFWVKYVMKKGFFETVPLEQLQSELEQSAVGK